MNSFLQRLSEPRPMLLDGAMGTELERRGVDISTPLWSAIALLDSPELVEQVHQDYLQAGAELIITNTFRTHRRNLERAGMAEQAARLTTLAASIAQIAIRESGKRAWVAGSMAPLEDSYIANALPAETYLAEHSEMAGNLAAAGVDLLLVETISTIREAQAAAQAAHATGLPFGVSFICKADGLMFSGEALRDAVKAVQAHQPSFLGINCSAAPSLQKALENLRAATSLPIAVYANPSHTEDYQHWDETEAGQPEVYAQYAQRWLEAGAQLVGGCCGTGPEHIAALSQLDSLSK
ncbi:MAG: homocysteine S-methyltransferase family protein [Anaerolineales bacterium]